MAPLVSIADLKVHFDLGRHRVVKAVDGVSLDIFPGETLGLVGNPDAEKPRSAGPFCDSSNRRAGV